MPDQIQIRDGRIVEASCGLLVAEHCNISCRGCSNLSPLFPRRFVDVDVVYRDLSMLAKAYRVQFVRILGGEPLLHPRLPDLLAAVRASGLADGIEVITNGTLLARMSEACWEQIDLLLVSAYPDTKLPADEVVRWTARADRHHVALVVQRFDEFREQYAAHGTSDTGVVRRIYDACQIVHTWRCQIVSDGYLYKCVQSYTVPRALDREGPSITADGLRIVDAPSFRDDLLAYLRSDEPLEACRRCLGTAGRLFRHQQVDRRGWALLQERTTEELLDPERLGVLESNPGMQNNAAMHGALIGGISRVV
jgi:organic radical activating enzyme